MKQTNFIKTFKLSSMAIILLAFVSFKTISAQILIEAESYINMYGVQTEACSEGGLNVGWIDANDWMEYSVFVPTSGSYTFELRVASPNNTGQIILSKNSTDIAIANIPNTGGWQNWTTISLTVSLVAGQQNLALFSSGYAYNLNWWQLTPISTNDTEAPTSPTNLIYTSTETEINLSWNASTDNVGVSGYNIYQNNNYIGSANTTSYLVSNLLAETTYNFEIEAYDAAGNISNKVSINATTQTSELTLVWADEFDYTGLPDSTKWGYDTGGHGWGNNELQYYTEKRIENTYVENGVLTIEAIQEQYDANSYTSARLKTSGKGDWTFGRVEVRAKLPYGVGTWPAIWMLPTDWVYGGWPSSGEIDIMEHVGYDMGNVHASTHSLDFNFQTGGNPTSGIYVSNVENEFHTYTIDWYPDRIEAFVDGVHYFTSTNDRTGWASWPFDKKFHIILNIAVGGNWGGANGVDPNIWPQKMVVDYVRVYDLNLPADTQAPNTPVNLTGTSSPSSVNLSWDHSMDNYSIEEYAVYMDGNLVGTTKYAGYTIDGLTYSTTYNFNVTAIDLAGNESALSSTATISTSDPIISIVPGIVQAEDFNGQYGVQTETCSEGGLNVGWIDTGDWMEYQINVATTGNYIIDYRTASAAALPGEIQILDDLGNILATTTLTTTGGWQTWETISSLEFQLNSGIQNISIFASEGGYNLNWAELRLAGTTGGGNSNMHIENIVTGTTSAGQGKKRGTATITVFDDQGNPASNATVTGTFTGSFNETQSGTTDIDGTITLVTNGTKKGSSSFSFCVDNISHSSFNYASNENVVTCINQKSALIALNNSLNAANSFSVYPNPVRNKLSVSLNDDLMGCSINLYDLTGKLMETYQNIMENKHSIDMTNFDNGIYLLEILDNNEKQIRKIIKQ